MNKYNLLFICCLGLVISGCQKAESEPPHKSALKSTASSVHITGKVVDPVQECQKLDQQLKHYAQQGITPKQLLTFNHQLKNCVGLVPLAQRYQWLDATAQLYSKFREQHESQSLYVYLELIQPMYDQNQRNAQSSSERKLVQEQLMQKQELALSQLTDQQRFAVQHLKELYLDIFCVEGLDFIMAQHPRYNTEIFAPHLLKADQAYLKYTLAEYTHTNVDVDAGLSISFDEIARRVMVWDKYQTEFPNSHFYADANENLQYYRSLLLLGLENTPVITTDHDSSGFIHPDALRAIQKVSQSHSDSGRMAQKFLEIIEQNKPIWRKQHAAIDFNRVERQQDEQAFFEHLKMQITALLNQTANPSSTAN